MKAPEMTATLAAFERRGPGTDAERRAARQVARDLTAAGYQATTEPFWGRPNWALAHAWHVALALAGSLLSVSHPTLGAALLAAALLSVGADGLTGVSPGRRLTPERASQNVVARTSPAPSDGTASTHPPTPLIVTATYDVARAALIYRPALRRSAATLRRLAGPLALGWLAWLSIVIAWSLAVAVIRATEQHPSHALGAIQLPPTVALVLALALLLEAAAAKYDDAASDRGKSAAVATAVATEARTRNLAVELVLQGAGEGQEIGMRRYLRAHRRALKRDGAIVLGIAASGTGPPVWWRSDGRLIPIRYTRQLTELAATAATAGTAATATTATTAAARPYRTRGGTPALPARTSGLAAITVGNTDTADPTDENENATHKNEHATERVEEFAARLIDAIDAALDPQPAAEQRAPTPA